jgi:hypothetical protein
MSHAGESQMNDEIDYIIDTFNFERVHIAMTAVDWKWAKRNLVPTEVPSVARLKQTARQMLEIAFNEKTTAVTGGLHAVYHPAIENLDPILSLSFVLAETNSQNYSND